MPINRYFVRVLVVSLTVVLAACAPVRQEPPHTAFETIDDYVARSMEQHGTPGLALGLTSRDELLYVGTYGFADLKSRKPVTEDTLFQIGSISKSFTALALMQLYDQGLFDPQRPVVESVPWFSVQTDFAPITAHHLLTHTAGIPANGVDVVGSRYMPWSLRRQATAWPPGERFHYSNVGFQMLHVVLEELSGLDYATIIQRRILDPLGMNQTNPVILFESRSEQAVGYLQPFDDRPSHRSRSLVEAPFFEYGMGDGSIQSTAADMCVYARMLLNRGRGPHGRIVSEEAFDLFATPYIENIYTTFADAYGYGIGFRSGDDRLVLTHEGAMVGLYALVVADLTNGLAVAVLVNGPADIFGIVDFAIEVMRATSDGLDLPSASGEDTLADVGEASNYAGVFSNDSGDSLEFKADRNQLRLQHGAGEIDLEPAGKDAFYTPYPEVDRYRFQFGRDESGAVVEVTHGPTWYRNSLYRGPTEFEAPHRWQAYTGRYRSYSPWFSYFEVAIVKGDLVVFTGEGGESSAGATILVPRPDGSFQVGMDVTPEVLRFEDVVSDQALRATWSGHEFHRIGW